MLTYQRGQFDDVGRQLDSARRVSRGNGLSWALGRSAELALLRGQVGKWRGYRTQQLANDSTLGRRPSAVVDAAQGAAMAASIRGDASAELKAAEAALARAPLRSLRDAERPDIGVAQAFAIAGRPDRARSVLADFEATVRDTALRRQAQPDIHTTRGLIALAESKPQEAIAEFRRGDVAPDGPANDCAICLPLALGRAFDAANQPDSAITQYEKYIATPFAYRLDEGLDASQLPAMHERLGQLYEAKGDAANAAKHYRAFIELWKNADPELQPRVKAARDRLAKLTPVEKPR